MRRSVDLALLYNLYCFFWWNEFLSLNIRRRLWTRTRMNRYLINIMLDFHYIMLNINGGMLTWFSLANGIASRQVNEFIFNFSISLSHFLILILSLNITCSTLTLWNYRFLNFDFRNDFLILYLFHLVHHCFFDILVVLKFNPVPSLNIRLL